MELSGKGSTLGKTGTHQPPRPTIVQLLDTKDSTHQWHTAVDVDEPLFQPFPPEINFTNFEPFHEYEAVLSLRNNDKVSRRVKVEPTKSPFFSAVPVMRDRNTGSSKIAAGMEACFTVRFKPQSEEDCACDIVIVTEREKFLVPVRAYGFQAALDFPDKVVFDPTPLRTESCRPILVRNIGEKATSFTLATTGCFSVVPKQGFLGPGETLQFQLAFMPVNEGHEEGEVCIAYENGAKVYAALEGSGIAVDVALSADTLELVPTFIDKRSMKTFTIYNRSDTVVRFSMRAHACHDDEEEYRKLETSRLERALTSTITAASTTTGTLVATLGGGNVSSDNLQQSFTDGGLKMTSRRLQRMKHAVNDNPLLFTSPVFELEPLEGTIWPNGEMHVSVKFTPDGPLDYRIMVFCDCTGLSERLPLLLLGQGVGPCAMFSFDTLDVGDTFINSVHQYEVELQNRGEIEAEFRLLPSASVVGQRFTFEPSFGVLSVGQIQPIQVTFSSDLLGDFAESFQWDVKGSSQSLYLGFRGRVVGPTFSIDVTELDFGVLSYGFTYTKHFCITNTSEIPMSFKLRLPPSVVGHITMIPDEGEIRPHGQQTVQLDFVAQSVRRFDTAILFDVPGVGEGLHRLPVLGDCCVPKISLNVSSIDFGDCYLRYPYTAGVTLINESKLPAKFEVIPQDELSQGLALYTAEPARGDIAAQGSQNIEFTLATERLGSMNLLAFIKIAGSKSAPLELVVRAHSMGPKLTFSCPTMQQGIGAGDAHTTTTTATTAVASTSADAIDDVGTTTVGEPSSSSSAGVPTTQQQQQQQQQWTPNIDFGRVTVLETTTIPLHVINHSLVPAKFKAFIGGKDSVFSVDVREGRLQPEESAVIKISVNPDEVMKFTDALNVFVSEGVDSMIPLSASGSGSTITCDSSLQEADFGYQFVNRSFHKKLVLHNRGRRPVTIYWYAGTILKPESSSSKRGTGKQAENKPDSDILLTESPRITISPQTYTIPSKSNCGFVISGSSSVPGTISEPLICKGMSSGKTTKLITEMVAVATVAVPMLEFDKNTLSFEYSYAPDVPEKQQKKPITVRNVSKLPLSFNLKTSHPYSIKRSDWSLGPGEAATLDIFFDATYKRDRQSTVAMGKLLCSYIDSAQKDSVELIGTLNYPNLDISSTYLDFGAVLNDTVKRMTFKLSNSSSVAAKYKWTFLEDAVKEKDDIPSPSKRGVPRDMAETKTPVNQLFDILPISGVIAPGDAVTVEVSYFAQAFVKAAALAVCVVEGGPEYEVNLYAESNVIRYSLETNHIDIGSQLYNKSVERDVSLMNSGRVPLNFRFRMPSTATAPGTSQEHDLDATGLQQLSRANVDVSPKKGLLEPGERQVFRVRVMPGLPDIVRERLYLEIAHFEAEELCIVGEGVYPNVVLSLPRLKDEDYYDYFEKAKQSLEVRGPSFSRALPPINLGAPGRRKQNSVSSFPRVSGRPSSGLSMQPVSRPTSAATMDRAAGERASVAHRRSSAAVSFVPTHVDVDVEGDRLRVIDNLLETARFEQNVQEQQHQGMKHNTDAALTAINSFASSSAAAATSLPNVILSKYVLDYGPVIKGTSKTKRFRLQNIGFHHVSFSVDASLLASCGFSLDPETTVRLPGAPEFETTELALTLQTSRLDSSVESVELCVPLELKNGPSVALNLRAAITVPEITVSTDVLDFGRVVAGNVSVISLQLHNPVEVPCEWSIKRPIGNYRYWSLFECSMSSGVIAPGGRVDMQVMFRPQQELAGVHVQKLQFRVNHSSRPITITVQGEGLARDIRFDRTEVELGALLPGDEKSTTVTMTNESDVSVELYSVDFDDEYIVQERVLRACDTYDGTNEMLMPVREIGEGLWEELLANNAFASDVLAGQETREDGSMRQSAVVAEASEQGEASLTTDDATAATTIPSTAGQDAAASRGSESSATVEAKAAGSAVEEGDDPAAPSVSAAIDEMPKVEAAHSWPDVDDTTNVILVGDTDAGSPLTVYAERLSARFGIGCVALDKIIASLQSSAENEEKQARDDSLKDENNSLTEKETGAAPTTGAAPLSPDRESAGEAADTTGVEQGEDDTDEITVERLTGALTEALHAGFSGGVILSVGSLPESLPCSDVVGSVLQSLGIVQEELVSDIPVVNDSSEEAAASDTANTGAAGDVRKGLWRGPKKVHVVVLTKASAPAPASLQKATKSAAGDEKTEEISSSVLSTFGESAALLRTFLAQGTQDELNSASEGCVSVHSLDDAHDADDSDAVNAVYRHVCQALPETATADPYYIKEQFTKEIVRRPSLREDRRQIQYFSLYSRMEDLSETPSASSSPVKDGVATESNDDVRSEKPVVHVKKTRWIIPPHASVELTVKFTSDDVGKFEEELCFEMVGVHGVQRRLRVRGTCAYPQISTDYRNVFYRKLKTRPPTPQISKQYIIPKQTFEFGAVLCGKDDTKVLAGEYAENQERFRITNNGLFDLKATFALRAVPKPLPSMSGAPAITSGATTATTGSDSGSGGEAADEAAKVSSEGTEDEHNSSQEPSGVFHISPTEMSLAVDETAELVVSAMPREDGYVNEVIVCSIEGNPIPVEFPISCLGAVPRVNLSTNELRFERLLVNHSSEMSFTLSNTAHLPCRWRLTGVDTLSSELSVSESMGVLAAQSSATVTVAFKAEKKAQYSTELTLEIVDADELLGVQQQEILLVSAEAYEIEVEPRYPDDQTGISFGTVKVQESVCKSFELLNNGKYEVGFSVSVSKNSAIKEIFTILPDNGTIEPGTSTTIEVHFNKNNKLRKEMQLVKNRDFQMSIIETLTGRREGRFPIMIDAEAVFSKYAVIPKEIDFGPNTFNTQPDAQVLEITNSGSFEFKFRLFDYTAYGSAASAAASPVKAGAGGSDDVVKAETTRDSGKDVDELTLGNFSIRPAIGSIPPGSKQVVEVRFKPEKSRTYAELLGIDISDRSDADHPGGIPFKLSGESCVPSIDTENVSSIFEEYRVVSSFDHAATQGNRNTYSIKDKSFSFGPVIVGTGADDGVKANFRFSNTNRVGCTVRFSITPRPGQDGDIPIEVHPQSTEIPPHEHRYVTCYFRPKAIMTYSAVFNAVVEDGEDPKRQRFRCGIQGEGTLPHLSIEHASHASEIAGESGGLTFPRMRLGKRYALPLTLKNTGIVPATARIEMEAHDAFSLRQSGTFTVEPKRSFITEIQFTPTEAKSFTHSLRLLVKSNPFETQTLALAGESYCEDVSFEGLPGDMDDELHFKDGPVGLSRTISFRVKNESREHPIRFEWPKDVSDAGKFISFAPSVGHLAPLAEKTVAVVFAPEEAVSLAPLELALATTKIAYDSSASTTAALSRDWDNMQTVKKTVPNEKLLSPLSSLSRTPSPEVVEAPEPEYTPIPDSEKSHVLKVHAIADNARYECDTGPIVFRTTMMFQSRTFSFPLRNTSTAMLEFEWQVCLTDGDPDMSSLYSVSPVSGSVPAGGEVSVTVRFSPAEVDNCERELVCMIDNLDSEYAPLRRRLSGSVSRPWCHFDLPESDYIRSGRRSSTRPAHQGADDASAQVDANTKVLEFESLGVRVKNTKRFFVLNPTSVSYEFLWERVAVPAAAAAAAASGGGGSSGSSIGGDTEYRTSSGEAKIQMPFTSLTKKGVIMPGRRYEMSFEFLPEKMDPCESLWRFRIPAQHLAVTFLLVGTVIEPAVLLSHPSLNFGKVLVGTTAKQVVEVVNEEEVPFRFSFDKASFKGLSETSQASVTEGGSNNACKQLVNITPSSGVVPPKSRVAASVEFSPTTERTMNVNVQCTIAKKPTKLMLNIKGDSYAIHEFLQISDEAGSGVRLSPSAPNFVDFGQVLLYDDAIKQVVLSNGGLVPFNFSWSTGSKSKVGATPEVGTVLEGERVVCKLKYRPTREEEMNGYKVTCSIQNGNSYVFFLSGKGHRPKLDFSMDKHDFGACFIHQQGMEPPRASLCVKNEDTMEVDLDCAFASKPHLQMDFKPTTLAPGESKTISLAFLPREAIAYKETLVFTANGLRAATIVVSGEGSLLKIELANSSQKVVSFGSVGIGQEVTRNVKIVNRSKAVASVSLEPCRLQLGENCISYAFTEKGDTGSIRLYPRQSENLRLTFKPTRRMCAFTEELVIQAGSAVTKTLSVLTGSGLGIDVQLETESLPFGTVVLGSRLVKHVQLRSHGELGAKFAWDTASLAPNFAITPSEGFIGPGQDVTLDISFTPTELSQDIRVENLTCKVAGAEPLSISLFGSCIENAAEERVLHFESKVREEDTQSIVIANPTNHAWHLKPVIENESWSGSDSLTVPANAEASYELSFRPTSMSKIDDDGSTKPHLGSAFFALPNGGGVLHRMEGVATPPRASGDVAVEVRAKSVHYEVLKVNNWLHRAQRFRCILDIGGDPASKIAASGDLGPKVSGAEFIDVPAHTERTYRLSFFTYVEGTYSGQVKFLNESTGEYIFYGMTFTSLPPEDISEIALETPVRQLVSETVTIENPLESSVTLIGSCAHDQVTLPASTTIEPGRRAFIEMTYRPLLVGEETCPASFTCAELGDYKYTLRLRGTPPPLDNSISFSVSLGAKQVLPFRFMHYLNAKAEYTCKFEGGTDSPFEVETSRVVAFAAGAEGIEQEVEVSFEPSRLGEIFRDTLVVSSSSGGEYRCVVTGRCTQPQPQGPIEIKGGSGTVAFKNIFAKEVVFKLRVDNPCFQVNETEKIASKHSKSIAISYKPGNASGSKHCRLAISCSDSPFPWIYYITAA